MRRNISIDSSLVDSGLCEIIVDMNISELIQAAEALSDSIDAISDEELLAGLETYNQELEAWKAAWDADLAQHGSEFHQQSKSDIARLFEAHSKLLSLSVVKKDNVRESLGELNRRTEVLRKYLDPHLVRKKGITGVRKG